MEPKKPPLMTPRLAAFMGAMILANISGTMHMPLLPLYLQKLGAAYPGGALHLEPVVRCTKGCAAPC